MNICQKNIKQLNEEKNGKKNLQVLNEILPTTFIFQLLVVCSRRRGPQLGTVTKVSQIFLKVLLLIDFNNKLNVLIRP